MAATTNDKIEIAKALKDLANSMKSAKYHSDQIAAKVSAEGWTPGAGDDQTLTDAGLNFTGTDVNNALGSLIQYRNFWNNAAVTQGDHGGNLEKLASTIP